MRWPKPLSFESHERLLLCDDRLLLLLCEERLLGRLLCLCGAFRETLAAPLCCEERPDELCCCCWDLRCGP